MRLDPPALAYDERGTPFSPTYGDVYHSADSGPGQARHVFLDGNELPTRWAHARAFTILETGFGLGLNFLATWRAWLDDAARPQRLHFVSIEKHPFDGAALAKLHARYGEFAPLAARLRDAGPPLVPGLHRLHFEGGRVTLTLAFGDITDVLPQLRLSADAIYLDGFASQRNPEMWSPHVMKRLARLSRAGTTLATWSTAGSVRAGLESAGFVVEKGPGFGHKREMLCARYAPRWPLHRPLPPAGASSDRHAIVVGAGLAGAAVTECLARRGWHIDLIDGHARSSSGHDRLAGVFHPHVSGDDCILSRLSRNGYLYAVSRWRALEHEGHALVWNRCGVLQLAGRAKPEPWMAETLLALGHPSDYAQYVDRARAESLSGCSLRGGGWWFPGSGWMRSSSLVDAQLAAANARRTTATVETIAYEAGAWRALAADGRTIAAAPVLVLANAHDAARLASISAPVDRVRGQVTYVPAAGIAAPRTIIAGAGYVLPVIDGVVMTGSTYDRDGDPQPHARAHEANIARLSQMLPHAPGAIDAATLDGAVGFRCVAPDRMPFVGPAPDVDAARARQAALSGAHLVDLPRRPGLYFASGFASRGLIWASAAGELLGSLLEGEPLALEGDLADAIDPARFVLRRLRTRTL